MGEDRWTPRGKIATPEVSTKLGGHPPTRVCNFLSRTIASISLINWLDTQVDRIKIKLKHTKRECGKEKSKGTLKELWPQTCGLKEERVRVLCGQGLPHTELINFTSNQCLSRETGTGRLEHLVVEVITSREEESTTLRSGSCNILGARILSGLV